MSELMKLRLERDSDTRLIRLRSIKISHVLNEKWVRQQKEIDGLRYILYKCLSISSL